MSIKMSLVPATLFSLFLILLLISCVYSFLLIDLSLLVEVDLCKGTLEAVGSVLDSEDGDVTLEVLETVIFGIERALHITRSKESLRKSVKVFEIARALCLSHEVICLLCTLNAQSFDNLGLLDVCTEVAGGIEGSRIFFILEVILAETHECSQLLLHLQQNSVRCPLACLQIPLRFAEMRFYNHPITFP